MSKCKEFRFLASRYTDYDLNEDEITKLKNHILFCDECRRVLSTYEKISGLIRECDIYARETVYRPEKDPPKARNKYTYPIKWSIGFAAICALLMTVTDTFFSFNTHAQRAAPVVISCNESRPIMNTPLGAMIYYEKLAGKTVHTQFVNIDSESKDIYTSTAPGSSDLQYDLSYESPLFVENTVASYHDKLLTGL